MMEYKIEVYLNLEEDAKGQFTGMLTSTNFDGDNVCRSLPGSVVFTDSLEKAFNSVYEYYKTHLEDGKIIDNKQYGTINRVENKCMFKN